MRTYSFFMTVIATASAFTLMGCPKDDADKDKDATGSCFREKDNACVEYGAGQAAAGKRLCSGMTWRAGEKSCPTSNRLGACKPKLGTGGEYLYGGPPNSYTQATAKTECESTSGIWTASVGPN